MRKQHINDFFEVEHFESVSEFIETINTRPLNKAFLSCGKESSKWGTKRFTHTESWDEAQQLLEKGYPKGCKAILQSGSIKVRSTSQRSRTIVDRVGTQAHVPNAIIGLPKAMMRRKNMVEPNKCISIYYDISAPSHTSASELERGGSNMYTFIKQLESKGYRVQLFLFFTCCKSITINGRHDFYVGVCTIKAKGFTQPVNPMSLSYVVTHPSMFRRHCFRWIETSDVTDHLDFVSGYGSGLRFFSKREFGMNTQQCLRKHNVIADNGYYIDCETMAMATSVDSITRYLNIA